VRNIGNYKQEKAILGANDPFGPNFDASIAYAQFWTNVLCRFTF
jgi:hypothetical protein